MVIYKFFEIAHSQNSENNILPPLSLSINLNSYSIFLGHTPYSYNFFLDFLNSSKETLPSKSISIDKNIKLYSKNYSI